MQITALNSQIDSIACKQNLYWLPAGHWISLCLLAQTCCSMHQLHRYHCISDMTASRRECLPLASNKYPSWPHVPRSRNRKECPIPKVASSDHDSHVFSAGAPSLKQVCFQHVCHNTAGLPNQVSSPKPVVETVLFLTSACVSCRQNPFGERTVYNDNVVDRLIIKLFCQKMAAKLGGAHASLFRSD